MKAIDNVGGLIDSEKNDRKTAVSGGSLTCIRIIICLCVSALLATGVVNVVAFQRIRVLENRLQAMQNETVHEELYEQTYVVNDVLRENLAVYEDR